MSILPAYLRDSHYAQKFEAASLAGVTMSEPLPSHLNDDKSVPHVVSISPDKMEVRFIGPVKNNDLDAASVRANCPMPSSAGLFYYEVTIISKGRDGFIGVGFCRQDVLLTRLPGWEDDSWGYHGDDGHSFCCHGTGQEYGPKFSTGDVIGCAINFVSGECFYTKNGVHLGVAFTGLTGELYPSIGLRTIGEQVRINFGAQPFVFDIDYYYRQEKSRLYRTVRDEEDDVSVQVQKLVSAYLTHEGYLDSARAMARDISMQTDKAISQPPIDMEASNRQCIRAAVTNGNMDFALSLLETLFPEVIKQHEGLVFLIRCRKFVEMMRDCSPGSMDSQREASNSKAEDNGDAVDLSMNIDETMADVPEKAAVNGKAKTKDISIMLNDAIRYGQELQTLYSLLATTNSFYRRGLEEAFSLLAYSDPMSSPMAHLLNPALRIDLAESINRAILLTRGKNATSELEEIVATVGSKVHTLKGTEFVNVQRDFLRND